jgi:glutamate dehydrogenase (NADP+)
MRCVVSGAGNVAQYCAELLLENGAVVLSLSDSRGYLYEPAGFTREQLDQVAAIKSQHGTTLADYKSPTAVYVDGSHRKPWELDTPIDMAFPCATQNELDSEHAKALASHGCKYVIEGANMPSTAAAIDVYTEHKIVYAPGKAANAGGVAVSGLEMSQNRIGLSWSRAEVTERLTTIMKNIYSASRVASQEYETDLAGGANIAGFLKVANAVRAQGAVYTRAKRERRGRRGGRRDAAL